MPNDSEPRNITAARLVMLKEICETRVLDSTRAAVVLKVIIHEKEFKIHACMTGKELMDVYTGRLLHIAVANSENVDVARASHKTIGPVLNGAE